MFLVGVFGIRFFVKIISIDRTFLIPVIFLLSIVGSYSMRNSLFDVGLAIVFGLIGYFMQRYDYPASPILLSLILGPLAESSLRRALIVSQGDFTILFTRPISLTLIILAVASLITATIMQVRLEKKLLAGQQSEQG
jgi:putative tricarboxylic transport membrane protein